MNLLLETWRQGKEGPGTEITGLFSRAPDGQGLEAGGLGGSDPQGQGDNEHGEELHY